MFLVVFAFSKASWVALGSLWGASWGLLEALGVLLGRSWVALGCLLGPLGGSRGLLVRSCGALGCFSVPLGASWVALGASRVALVVLFWWPWVVLLSLRVSWGVC